MIQLPRNVEQFTLEAVHTTVMSPDLLADVTSNSYSSTTSVTFEHDVSLSYTSASSFMQWKQ